MWLHSEACWAMSTTPSLPPYVSQAVNSSDFAISQFKHLERLLMIHGRWNYRRICKVILYSFYKNITLTLVLFYYTFYTG